MATKTHKDRVNEFNSKLEALSEHHDIPKVCLVWLRAYRVSDGPFLGWPRITRRLSLYRTYYMFHVTLPFAQMHVWSLSRRQRIFACKYLFQASHFVYPKASKLDSENKNVGMLDICLPDIWLAVTE